MKRGKWTKAYQRYRERYYIERKLGNVKQGVKVYSAKQYKEMRTIPDKDLKRPLTDKEILNAQTMLQSKAGKNKVWRDYLRLRKTFKRGTKKTYKYQEIRDIDEEGDILFEEREEELYYHYNLQGLLRDKFVIHRLITARIAEGEDRKEVLADYGY